MTALDMWKQQVRACRQSRKVPDAQIWQHAANWYESWVENNDYATILVDRLQPLLNGHSRILEVGPGSGGVTVPLADRAEEIVALEPSADMRRLLDRNLAACGKGKVYVIPKPVEQGLYELDGSFDLALASYSLYNVESIDAVMRDLVQKSRVVVALMGSGEPRQWYQELYRHFRGQDPVPPPQVQYLYPLLLELGIYADVEIFWTSHNYVYDSKEAMVEWWRHHLHLPESERGRVQSALMPLAEEKNGQIGIYSKSRAAMVTIEKGRNAESTPRLI